MKKMVCIVCPVGCRMEVDEASYSVKGNKCSKGATYGKKELVSPTRIITTTVKISNAIHNRLPVKTSSEVPKEKIFDIMRMINKFEISSPVSIGDILIENILETGVDIIATRNM